MTSYTHSYNSPTTNIVLIGVHIIDSGYMMYYPKMIDSHSVVAHLSPSFPATTNTWQNKDSWFTCYQASIQ
jgi:hypothetical protein